MWLQPEEREEPPLTTMEQYVQYNQLQWQYYNELYHKVHNEGVYGAYYEFLIAELEDGPYWSDVKAQFGTVREPEEEREPEPSVSGSREPQPEDDSSDDDPDDWIYLLDIISNQPKNEN